MKKTIWTTFIVSCLSLSVGCDDAAEPQSPGDETVRNTPEVGVSAPPDETNEQPVHHPHVAPGVDPLVLGIMREVRFFIAQGDTVRAMELLRQAIDIDNSYLEAYTRLFELERANGDDVSAAQTCVTIISEGLATGFDLVQLEMECAETHVAIGQHDEAERLARLSVDGAPANLAPKVLLSGVLLASGRAQECVELLDGNIGQYRGPVELAAISNLALAYAELGQFEESISLLEDTLSNNPYRTDLLLNLADVLRRAGREEESRAALERILLIEPDNEQVRALLDE